MESIESDNLISDGQTEVRKLSTSDGNKLLQKSESIFQNPSFNSELTAEDECRMETCNRDEDHDDDLKYVDAVVVEIDGPQYEPLMEASITEIVSSLKRSRSPCFPSTSSSSTSSEETEIGLLSEDTESVQTANDTTSTAGMSDALFSLKTLSKSVSSNVMQEVQKDLKKAHSATTDPTIKLSQIATPSPALSWEERRKLKEKQDLNRSLIKAGWRVRQALAELPPSKSVNEYYLEIVNRGEIKNVQALFGICKTDPRFLFNPNSMDQYERSALRIAIDNQNAEMCDVLLSHKVKIGDCLFHAIKQSSLTGVETILKHDKCLDKPITGENYYFPAGITPIIYAAYCNNYDVLKILQKHEHKLEDAEDWSKGIRFAWESANKRRMLCKARCSPAYITLRNEAYHDDVMEYCIQRIREVRENARLEQEYSEFYEQLERILEDYMCSLLDQIRSSEELAKLFKYDYETFSDGKEALRAFADGSASRSKIGSRLDLLDTASDERLVKFVTHYNAQLSLTYMRYRYVPFLRHAHILKLVFLRFVVGLLFPVLSIFYIISPSSKLGSLLTLPTVSYHCHMMSDIMFIAIIFLNVINKSIALDYLGAPPTALEWLLFFWILGKWLQEIQECLNRSWRKYFSDNWNYNDLLQLSLFTIGFALRIIDFTFYGRSSTKIPRSQWTTNEPRLLSQIFFAWAYLFVFLRILNLFRADRVLGPLQVTLARMLMNILQFLCIFVLVIFTFSLSLTELYWFYGTTEGKQFTCSVARNTTTASNSANISSFGNATTATVSATCANSGTLFSNLGGSLVSLFWSIFGHIDLTQMSLSGKHQIIETICRTLLAAYHVVAIIVLVNMLIAMMTKSYEITSSNEENEWKFHRTSLWIRFIRREVVRPPPMNLLPNPYRFAKKLRHFFNFVKRSTCCQETVETEQSISVARNALLHQRPVSKNPACRSVVAGDLRKQKSKKILLKLVQRYKYGILLNASQEVKLDLPKPLMDCLS